MREGFEQVKLRNQKNTARFNAKGQVRIPTSALAAMGYEGNEKRCYLYYNAATREIAIQLVSDDAIDGYLVGRYRNSNVKTETGPKPLVVSLLPVMSTINLPHQIADVTVSYDLEDKIFYVDVTAALKIGGRPQREAKALPTG